MEKEHFEVFTLFFLSQFSEHLKKSFKNVLAFKMRLFLLRHFLLPIILFDGLG